MAVSKIVYPSIDERKAKGEQAGQRTPPSSHAGWSPAAGRLDPVTLLQEQNLTREPDLVPVRHGRMMVSPACRRAGNSRSLLLPHPNQHKSQVTASWSPAFLKSLVLGYLLGFGGRGAEGWPWRLRTGRACRRPAIRRALRRGPRRRARARLPGDDVHDGPRPSGLWRRLRHAQRRRRSGTGVLQLIRFRPEVTPAAAITRCSETCESGHRSSVAGIYR